MGADKNSSPKLYRKHTTKDSHTSLPRSRSHYGCTCWGSGPAHVRVSGPLCELEGFLVNTASTKGSEENNH
jgi:hypothetical protein